MSARFVVLASGSTGNASLLEIAGHTLLIDFGVGPRKLARLLAEVERDWDCLRGVLLTHVHGDHCNDTTLAHFLDRRLPLWCHPHHAAALYRSSDTFHDMSRAGLVRVYQTSQSFDVGPCTCTPLPVWHDVPTFAFRFDGPSWALGFATDLGSWAGELVDRLADVDLLALEFNHDIEMQLTSRRHDELIERVLGDDGHLSNIQAGKLLGEILRRSTPGRLRHLVALHLSQDCNHPNLALAAADDIRRQHDADFSIHPAHHACPSPWFHLGEVFASRSA